MGRRHLARATALLILVACGPSTEAPPGGSELAQLVPEPSALGAWRAAEGPVEYTRETLYEYLDGGAERYLTYGFRALNHVRYEPEGDPLGGVAIDVYDMGSELGAFGIYRGARPPRPEVESWCAEGYRSGTVVAGWKGRHYVHGEVDHERPELVATMGVLMAQICGRIVGSTSLPAMLDPLPPDGLVPLSERWVANNLLGHAFLPGGVIATYALDGGEVRLFFSDLTGEIGATDALARLRDHESRAGGLDGDVDSIGAGGFRFSGPGIGSGTVVRVGRFVAGVHGGAPHDAQERLLARLIGGLEGWSMGP
jgi:hypothetical protein